MSCKWVYYVVIYTSQLFWKWGCNNAISSSDAQGNNLNQHFGSIFKKSVFHLILNKLTAKYEYYTNCQFETRFVPFPSLHCCCPNYYRSINTCWSCHLINFHVDSFISVFLSLSLSLFSLLTDSWKSRHLTYKSLYKV